MVILEVVLEVTCRSYAIHCNTLEVCKMTVSSCFSHSSPNWTLPITDTDATLGQDEPGRAALTNMQRFVLIDIFSVLIGISLF